MINPKFLATDAYARQREIINREVNSTSITYTSGKVSYAHISLIPPARYITVDRSVFRQTPQQKADAYTVKMRLRKDLREVYGQDWKRHLNTPKNSIGSPIKMSF